MFVGILSWVSVAFAQLSPEQALISYIHSEDVEGVQQVLAEGANPNGPRNIRDRSEDCFGLFWVAPLHCAARSGNTAIVRLLIEYGADANVFGLEGGGPFQVALDHDHTDIADMIVNAPNFDASRSVRRYDRWRTSPYLEVAIRNESARFIRILLDRGADDSLLSINDRQNMIAILRAYETTVTPSDTDQ